MHGDGQGRGVTGAMRIAVILLATLLVGLIGLSAWLALQSCGVRIPFTQKYLSVCETDEALRTRADLAGIIHANRALETRIGYLEHRLGGLICKADPPPPPPPPPPPKPKTPSGLDPDAFDEKDISVMEGCWQLSSNYSVREINTGRITRFKYWRICFDKNGNGTETMRSTDGVRCQGRIKGRIPGNGKLTMREPGNLQCDNDSSIFRRDITCTIDKNGAAQCDTYQPETQGRSAATLRRARR